MKLVQLSCDRPSFKTLRFNPEGLTLIVGDAAKEQRDEGSSNGVGKTLALGLIHHCLGGTLDKRLRSAVPDWRFVLDFQTGHEVHRIERSGDSKVLALDERAISLKALQGWLDRSGGFRIDPNTPRISFRALFSRFARWHRDDCTDPLQTRKEQPFDALLRSMYLMGADVSLIASKRELKLERDALSQSSKAWQQDPVMKDLFRAGAQPKVRSEHLEREVLRLKADLAAFQVAEDYRAIELQAGERTRALRQIETQQAVVRFQLEGIAKSLRSHPDIGRRELLELYQGLQEIFKPSALAHFEAVETFHRTLDANRKARFKQDELALTRQLTDLERSRQEHARLRDENLQLLHGKRALDEYAALARQVAGLEEEKRRIDAHIELSTAVQQKGLAIRERQVDEDRLATDYALTQPLHEHDRYFAAIAERLYPRSAAGIVLENNLGDNQTRYDLTVQIEGDASDGINAARILCFDWMLLTRGSNHTMDLLWHDNRLFADMDPRPRAAWFNMLLTAVPSTGKQYVASINTENFHAMEPHLSADRWSQLQGAVQLVLRGDRPANKLLGIQFGGN